MALTKITSDVIGSGAIESGHIASGAIGSGHLTNIDTDNVSEGSTNTYFTNARARGSISVTGGNLAYDNSTGVLQLTDSAIEGAISTLGAISTGNITTTGYLRGPSTFTIDPAAHGDNTGTLVIAGNLQVDGTTTTINSTTLTVDDKNIVLASGAANAAAANGAGITVDGASATITYDGTNDEWDFNKDINVTGTVTASGNITGTLATAAQPNITSVGTLTSLNASGSVKLDKSLASSDFLGDANIYSLRLTNDNTTAGNAVGLSFGHGGFNFTSFIASVRTGTGNNPKGDLVFGNRPSDGTAFVERMRIQANGHVGIGETNPNSKLSIVGGATSPGLSIKSGGNAGVDPFRVTWTNGTEGDMFIVDDNGNVGIGTTQPSKALDISNTTSAKINLQGGTNQNGMSFAAAGTGGVSSSQYYLGVGSGLMGSDYGAVFLDVTNNRSVLLDDQSNSRLGFYNNSMVIDSSGNVGIGTNSPDATLHLKSITTNSGPSIIFENTNNAQTMDIDYYSNAGSVQSRIQYSEGPGSFSFFPNVSNSASLVMDYDGFTHFHANRSEYGITVSSASNRAGIVLEKPGTSTVMGSMLMLETGESFNLGTASNYHIRMSQNGSTFLGDTANTHFSSSGNLYMGTTTNFIAYNTVPGSQWSTIAESIGYGSQGYSASQGYWHHLQSKGGTHITINSDATVTAAENTFDDFVIWQGTQDSGEPLFRVSNTGRVIAKQNYEIGNHKTNKEEFGVSAINTVDTATSDINTTTTNTYENRAGVYWLNFNSKRFRAYVKPNWLQQRNWVLAAKFFYHADMPAGSSLWTNDASWNAGDFDLNNGHFSKYGMPWRYFGFTRLAMQMGDRVAPIMQFNSTQTLYGAFSGGLANNAGVTANSTDPAMSGTGVTYHNMTNYLGGTFTDLGGLEDRMQSYGLNKWMGSSTNSTSSNNQGSRALTAGGKGFELTVEDSHDNIGGNDSIGRAGAWIGCPMDEGASTQGGASGNIGADSAFGFGAACGNNPRTWTSGIGEWGRGNEVANYLPAYIWLSID